MFKKKILTSLITLGLFSFLNAATTIDYFKSLNDYLPLKINENIELKEIVEKYGVLEFKLEVNDKFFKKLKENKIIREMVVNYIKQKFLQNFPKTFNQYTIYVLFISKSNSESIKNDLKCNNGNCNINEKGTLLVKIN